MINCYNLNYENLFVFFFFDFAFEKEQSTLWKRMFVLCLKPMLNLQ